jgi:hypothetical protein
MSQYRDGFVDVQFGTTTIIGSNTEWTSNVSTGHTFKVEGIDAIYDINGVISNTCISLMIPYAGASQQGLKYQIHRDFTPHNKIPEIHEGDRDWPFYLTKSIRTIDAINHLRTDTQILETNNADVAGRPNGWYSGITSKLVSSETVWEGSITMMGGTLCNNTTTTTLPAMRMVLSSHTGGVVSTVLLQGIYKRANTFNFPATRIGYPLYATTSGNMTTTALAAGLYQQIVGVVVATNTVYFNPSLSIVRT